MAAGDYFSDLQELELDAIIELWTIDNTANGGTTYRFHSSNKNNTDTDIDFDSITYTATPIEISKVEMTANGKPRPRMAIGTQAAVTLSLLSDPDLLLGAKCTRIKTLAKYLDNGSSPDTTAVADTVVFYVEQLESVTDASTVYRLADPTELPDTKLPRQIVMANLCSACYRGDTCQYAGDPLTDDTNTSFGAGPFTDRGTWSSATSDYVADDYVSIDSPEGVPFVWVALQSVPAGIRPGSEGADVYWSLDVCFKKESDCEQRFDAETEGLNFDAFPGAGNVPI